MTTSDAKISHFENSDQILPYPVENEFKHLNLSTGVLDSSNCRVCDEVRDLDVNWFHYLDKMVADYEAILRSEKYHFQECRIPVLSHLNIEFFKCMLSDYEDADIYTLLEYGFPIGYENLETRYTGRHVNNHKGALENSADMDKYLIKEISKKAVLGPFHSNPFSHEIVISPLNSVPKKGSEDRRVILDLSVRGGGAINGFIDKNNYLGEEVNLRYPNVDVLVDLIKKHGRNCLIFKRDLSRAYCQIFIDLHDAHFSRI